MDLITYALAKKHGGESITYTLTADTENKTIVLTPSEGTAQVITVPYATDASTVNGHEVPELENGKIPANFLPSFVDNVDEYDTISLFPVVGESNRIYIDKSTNKTYRWSGTAYVEISESIALGETSSTAYRGDRGKIAYDHSQSAHAPSNAEANQNAFSNVKIDSDTINASTATDTLEFIAGDNIILTPNVSNKKITVSQAPVRATASGDIASFSDGAGYPFLKVKANINPVQDLHGYDYPWVGGAGKNKLPFPYPTGSSTINGVTFTVQSDGSIVANGTASANAEFYLLYEADVDFPAGTYTLSGLPNGGGYSSFVYNFFARDANNNMLFDYRTGTTSTQTVETAIKKATLGLRIIAGYTANNLTVYPQLEVGSSATSYAPYSNICPISGFTGVNVTVSPTTTEGSGTVYPISWQDEAGIVYGGYIDLVSGVLTVTKVSADLGTLDWRYDDEYLRMFAPLAYMKQADTRTLELMCSQYRTISDGRAIADVPNGSIYNTVNNGVSAIFIHDTAYTSASDFKTAMNGVQLVYELATPQTYQLTPQQINTLIGQNNVWNNTNGQTEVEYKAPFYNDLTTKNEVQALINESITSALNASY